MNERAENAVVTVRGLRKRYDGNEVVAGIDLSIAQGRCVGLLGPNGAGKTTTLRLLLGLIDPEQGDIRLLDHVIPDEAPEARKRIGVVPQMDNLDPDFSVRENLTVYGRYFGLSASDIARRIPPLLDFAGLAARADTRVQQLSGGMRRRLTLARALINDPDLIMLDEPTTGLDPQARHVIWQWLRRLAGQGKTLLLTTHFMEEAERLCDEVHIMDEGKVIASGHPRALIAEHIEPDVLEIFGEQGWPTGLPDTLCERVEVAGETRFCYTRDGGAALQILRRMPEVRYLHRPANLEDVFLKLTGRELRD
jgi:lipooligosaccharide transport system ATP-binding protein